MLLRIATANTVSETGTFYLTNYNNYASVYTVVFNANSTNYSTVSPVHTNSPSPDKLIQDIFVELCNEDISIDPPYISGNLMGVYSIPTTNTVATNVYNVSGQAVYTGSFPILARCMDEVLGDIAVIQISASPTNEIFANFNPISNEWVQVAAKTAIPSCLKLSSRILSQS